MQMRICGFIVAGADWWINTVKENVPFLQVRTDLFCDRLPNEKIKKNLGKPLCYKEHFDRMIQSSHLMGLNVDFDIVTKSRGSSTNFCTHITDGTFTRAGKGFSSWAKIFDNRPCTSLNREDTSNF